MPISSGGSGVPGETSRQFPWQVDHNCVRGGPNDPVIQTTPASPVNSAVPTGGGSISWNTTFTLGPVPGQAAPRIMSLNSTGTLAGGQLTSNSGGLLLLTVPQGAWMLDVQLYCYAALSGGSSTSIGFFYDPEPTDTGYPPVTPSPNLLAYITGPAVNTLYGIRQAAGVSAFTAVLGAGSTAGTAATPLGPGSPVTGNIGVLASLGPINIYIATFLIAGSGTPPTGGCFSAFLNFSGLEG